MRKKTNICFIITATVAVALIVLLPHPWHLLGILTILLGMVIDVCFVSKIFRETEK